MLENLTATRTDLVSLFPFLGVLASKLQPSYTTYLGIKHNFWGSVPASSNILSKCGVPVILIDLTEGACQSKVTQFNKAIRVEKDVRGLQGRKELQGRQCQSAEPQEDISLGGWGDRNHNSEVSLKDPRKRLRQTQQSGPPFGPQQPARETGIQISA